MSNRFLQVRGSTANLNRAWPVVENALPAAMRAGLRGLQRLGLIRRHRFHGATHQRFGSGDGNFLHHAEIHIQPDALGECLPGQQFPPTQGQLFDFLPLSRRLLIASHLSSLLGLETDTTSRIRKDQPTPTTTRRERLLTPFDPNRASGPLDSPLTCRYVHRITDLSK
jgi:hypothetical protein